MDTTTVARHEGAGQGACGKGPLPLTLGADQRGIVANWPDDVRRRFEQRAGNLEFIGHKTIEDAESEAFNITLAEVRGGK